MEIEDLERLSRVLIKIDRLMQPKEQMLHFYISQRVPKDSPHYNSYIAGYKKLFTELNTWDNIKREILFAFPEIVRVYQQSLEKTSQNA